MAAVTHTRKVIFIRAHLRVGMYLCKLCVIYSDLSLCTYKVILNDYETDCVSARVCAREYVLVFLQDVYKLVIHIML